MKNNKESLTNIEFKKVQKQFEDARKAFENFDKESFQEEVKKFREYQILKDIEKFFTYKVALLKANKKG